MLVYENGEVEINNFEVEDKLPLFLNSVLDRAESDQCRHYKYE